MAENLASDNYAMTSLSTELDSIETDKENKESITLIWFDPNIGSREDTELTKQQLRHINDYVTFYTALEPCAAFIKSSDTEKIFLITSGRKASEILPRIMSFRQVDSVFIYCWRKDRYTYLTNEYSNVIGIYDQLDELCDSIKEQTYLAHKQLQTFSFFDQHQKSTKDLSKQSAEFLWFQLFNYVITRLPRNEQAKQQMIQVCRQYYRGNTQELKVIDRFERQYQPEDAIRWFSEQSFVYKLINKALRIEDIDFLHIFRFFIGDLSQNLSREHKKMLFLEDIITVYRGTKLDKEEFDKLKENEGKLISTNGYLSTSRNHKRALDFAAKLSKRNDIISVLFEIKCDVKQIGESVIFADIAEFSVFPDEEEVLFDLSACFRIESIEENGSVKLIRMKLSNEGQTITKDYFDLTQKETEEKSVSIVFGRLMCNLGEYDKSQKYFEQLLKDPNGEDVAWIEFNIGRALYHKGKCKEAREYYDRAYDRMMNATPARIKDSAYVLNNIGLIFDQEGDYEEALTYHRKALKVRADYYHQTAHVDVATSFNNIGLIHCRQGRYDDALDHHREALKIKRKCYPSGHASIGDSLNNIGVCYENLHKREMALDHYQQVLTIYEKFLPVQHPNRMKAEDNVRRLT